MRHRRDRTVRLIECEEFDPFDVYDADTGELLGFAKEVDGMIVHSLHSDVEIWDIFPVKEIIWLNV